MTRRRISFVILACTLLLGITEFVRGVCRISSPKTDNASGSAQYVIILGGGQKKGLLGKSAVERVRSAAVYMKEHPSAMAIASGGRGRWGDAAESTLLKRELSLEGISCERVLEEGQSADTVDNLRYSARVIAEDRGIDIAEALQTRIAIATSDYHLSRAVYIAHRLGYGTVEGVAAKTPRTALLRSWVREVAAWVKLDLVKWCTGRPRSMLLEDGGAASAQSTTQREAGK